MFSDVSGVSARDDSLILFCARFLRSSTLFTEVLRRAIIGLLPYSFPHTRVVNTGFPRQMPDTGTEMQAITVRNTGSSPTWANTNPSYTLTFGTNTTGCLPYDAEDWGLEVRRSNSRLAVYYCFGLWLLNVLLRQGQALHDVWFCLGVACPAYSSVFRACTGHRSDAENRSTDAIRCGRRGVMVRSPMRLPCHRTFSSNPI